MPWRQGDLLEFGFDLLVFAGNDDDLGRVFDLQKAAEKLFDRSDAESTGQLKDDGSVADQALAAEGTGRGPWVG